MRGTTSRGMRGLVCPSRTSERGGKGFCVKEGWREPCEGVCEEKCAKLVTRTKVWTLDFGL
jgi:hypothetical protein